MVISSKLESFTQTSSRFKFIQDLLHDDHLNEKKTAALNRGLSLSQITKETVWIYEQKALIIILRSVTINKQHHMHSSKIKSELTRCKRVNILSHAVEYININT